MIRTRIIVWSIVAIVVVGFLLLVTFNWDEVQEVWSTLLPGTRALVKVVSAGVFASILADLILHWSQKKIWAEDVKTIERNISSLADQVASLGSEVNGVKVAFGGPFVRSLWSYHPYSSQKIAEVLSEETNRIYSKHWKRTIVTRGKDLYRIVGLRKVEWAGENGRSYEGEVWDLDFHIRWTWKNDSKVSRNPLDDLLVLISAPAEEISAYDDDMPLKPVDQYQQFLAERSNRVLAPIANPLKPKFPLSKGVFESLELFSIDRLKFNWNGREQVVSGAELEDEESLALPSGIYRALRLPATELKNATLHVGEEMDVIYTGKTTAIVERSDSEESDKEPDLWGALIYPPSDIVGWNFELALKNPSSLEYGGKRYKLVVDRRRSFCRYIHEPAAFRAETIEGFREDLPTPFRPSGNGEKLTTIRVDEGLTDLHLLKILWKAELVSDDDVEKAEKDGN